MEELSLREAEANIDLILNLDEGRPSPQVDVVVREREQV